MLGQEPIYNIDVGIRIGDQERAQRLAQRVYELGRRARGAADPAHREEI